MPWAFALGLGRRIWPSVGNFQYTPDVGDEPLTFAGSTAMTRVPSVETTKSRPRTFAYAGKNGKSPNCGAGIPSMPRRNRPGMRRLGCSGATLPTGSPLSRCLTPGTWNCTT